MRFGHQLKKHFQIQLFCVAGITYLETCKIGLDWIGLESKGKSHDKIVYSQDAKELFTQENKESYRLYGKCLLKKQGKLEIFIINDLEKKLKSSIEKIVGNSDISLYVQLVLLPSTIIKIFINKNLEINDMLEAFEEAEKILLQRKL